MAGNVQITGGNFQDLEGNLLSLGRLEMKLSHNELSPNGQVCSGIVLNIPLDANGNVSGSVFVWSNDVLLPINSYYTVRAYSSLGQLAWGRQQLYILTPTPFNLNSWNP
jgi:hypothetical protein